jgi:anti-sigma B factor antagonist
MAQIKGRVIGNVVVLEVAGTLAQDGALASRISSLLHGGYRDFVLNFARVKRIDAVGLSLLVASAAQVRVAAGRVAVANLTNRLSDMLAITRVVTLFDVYGSELEALLSFPASAVQTPHSGPAAECLACAGGLHGIMIADAPAAAR